MGTVRRFSVFALVLTLSSIGIPLPAHAADGESPPLTFKGHPLSQLLSRTATGDSLPLADPLGQEAGEISGIASDGVGQPLANLTVRLTKIVMVGASRGEQVSGTDTTDAEGRFSFTGLEAREYLLEALVGDEVVASASQTLSVGAMQVSGVSLAWGVDIASSFQGLRTLVESGTEVSVIDVAGNEIVGDIVEISASTLTLSADGNRREFRESDVVRVTRPPHGMSRVVGGLIGFGVAFGVVAVAGNACTAGSGCGQEGEAAALFGVLLIAGPVVGALATGRTEEELLFQSGRTARSAPSVLVSPVFSRNAKGVALSLGW